MPSAKYEGRYDSLLQYYGDLYRVDWKLLKCQIRAESNFNPTATSPVGALGLAQFMEPTWKDWGGGGARTNPEASIQAQARYMSWLHGVLRDDIHKVLAAYNWGIGHVRKTFKDVPYDPALVPAETSAYVEKILRWMKEMDDAGQHP